MQIGEFYTRGLNTMTSHWDCTNQSSNQRMLKGSTAVNLVSSSGQISVTSHQGPTSLTWWHNITQTGHVSTCCPPRCPTVNDLYRHGGQRVLSLKWTVHSHRWHWFTDQTLSNMSRAANKMILCWAHQYFHFWPQYQLIWFLTATQE